MLMQKDTAFCKAVYKEQQVCFVFQSLYILIKIKSEDLHMSGRFPNVDWWCDYCGALLNYQNGFDDSNDTWACTECGTINRISASEIYESHKDYRKKNHLD